MESYYTYLLSSLPMLHFGMKSPFLYEDFLKKCAGLLCKKDISILKRLREETDSIGVNKLLKSWVDFNTALKNELVKIRAQRKNIDPHKYIRPGEDSGINLFHTALAAQRNPSPLEGERLLDTERWNFLQELGREHYFDAEALFIYALKLLILERWERINTAKKEPLVEQAVSSSQKG